MIIIKKHILFVCTGNTCRSPFAEAVMRKILHDKYGEKAEDIKVTSAGTYAVTGVEPPPDALNAAKRFNVDISQHRSRSIHLSMMESSDAVFCMTYRHKAFLMTRFPWFENKIFVLKQYAFGKYDGNESENAEEEYDIKDPIGQGLDVYVDVFEEIRINVEKILERFEQERLFRRKISRIYKIAIGSDHAGFRLKEEVSGFLAEMGHSIEDFGTNDASTSVDYPDFAGPVAKAVAVGNSDFGILCCGSGVGMSISANRIRGARAVVANDIITAKLSRSHNDSNILCLGERLTTGTVAKEIVQAWLTTSFDGGRHEKRVKKMDEVK